LRRVMDLIPTLETPVTVASLADRVGLLEMRVERYLRGWEDKGLVTLE